MQLISGNNQAIGIVALFLLLLLAFYCAVLIRRELRHRKPRSTWTGAAVWALYLLYTALVMWSAWMGAWPLPLEGVLVVPALGALLALGGATLSVAGMLSFRSLQQVSGTEMQGLVQTGAYRWSRHPQNVGWGVFLLGVALLGRSGLSLLMTGLFWTAFLLHARREERYLESVYGEAYRCYRQTTPCLLGRPRRMRMLEPPNEKTRNLAGVLE